jgi:predicted ArsR family transcriptional regulator
MTNGGPEAAAGAVGVGEEPRRLQVLAVLRDAPEGLDISELAGRLELHPNTIRWHLGRLADDGLVSSSPVHRGHPGRPRIVYEATSGAPEPVESYRFLAEVLASALAGSTEGEILAEQTGRAWGQYLVDRPPPASYVSHDEAVDRIVGLLAGHGFAPERRGDVIEMHRCPFHDLVETYGEIVCGLHRGLLSGALETLGSEVALDHLDPYPAPGLCRAHLRRT